jgi:transcription elongation GreA/GreB family factor
MPDFNAPSGLDALKKQLYNLCRKFVENRILTIEQAMAEAQAAANEESKSSAGDKYETTRSMMQLERDRHATQLAQARKMQQELADIQIDKPLETIQPGSLILTSGGNFFIAIAAGKMVLEEKTYFAVSSASPIGEILSGKKAGDIIPFQGKTIEIQEVF